MLRAQDITPIKEIKGLDINPENENGKRIVYKVNGIKPETISGNKRKEIIPQYKNVPCMDQIMDEDGNVKTIAFTTSISPDGNVKLGRIIFTAASNGLIIINTKKGQMTSRERQMYEYFEATDFNGSKKNRDKSKPIIFIRDNPEHNAEAILEYEKMLMKAKQMVLDCKDEEIEALCELIGTAELTGPAPISVKRSKLVKNYCVDSPQTIITAMEEATLEAESLLRLAVNMGMMEHQKVKGQKMARFVMNDNVVFEYENLFGAKAYQLFAREKEINDPKFLENLSKTVKLRQMENEEKRESKELQNTIS